MGYKNKYIWNSTKSEFEQQDMDKKDNLDYDKYFENKRSTEKEEEERKILRQRYSEFVMNSFGKFSFVIIILLILLIIDFLLRSNWFINAFTAQY